MWCFLSTHIHNFLIEFKIVVRSTQQFVFSTFVDILLIVKGLNREGNVFVALEKELENN